MNDVAAYFFGFYFGKTPLIKLSPKKTWEGFIGASVATIISAFFVIIIFSYLIHLVITTLSFGLKTDRLSASYNSLQMS